jgi:anaerobic magnesium-protoporphyrin IX monomethyl ester cyclase
MKINLVTIEDGLNNTGFRKIAGYTRMLHPNTDVFYVVTGNSRSFAHLLFSKGGGGMPAEDAEAIAERIADADLIGFSSMTAYSLTTAAIIAAVRRRNPKAYIVWGGIHAIIEPEDAILHADAVCTGEGEFAFEAFLAAFKEGRPFFETRGFWFNTPDGVRKNPNLPLMTGEEMDRLPIPLYQDGEYIYRSGRGFAPIGPADFVAYNGLTYKTVWSIGCPMKCTYCGNSKFIDYDRNYRKIRHSSPATIIAELKEAVRRHPHVSTIVFDDDSFMALPIRVMEEFCTLYRAEIGMPFVVTGLIPNYVREDKLRLLISAGMNRVRMGIQSGSQAILDFYERPTPVARIREACRILNGYRQSMIPPAFDIILDNPIETVEDNQATLDLIHEMPRPYTLNIFSLRIIPNTRLSAALEERGVAADDIRKAYTSPQATLSNILVFAMTIAPLPERLYRALRERARPAHMTATRYPLLMMAARFLYLSKRAADHLLLMDLTVLSGAPALLLWKLGLVTLWQKWSLPRAAARARAITPPVIPPQPQAALQATESPRESAA